MAYIISDKNEKTHALNSLMAKYQSEGRYESIKEDMAVLDAVAIIKIKSDSIKGKYNIGQHLTPKDRINLAEKILARGSQSVEQTLKTMGFGIFKLPMTMTSLSLTFFERLLFSTQSARN